MDGVDAAAFRIIPLRADTKTNGHTIAQCLEVEMIDALLHPLPAELARKMQSIISCGQVHLDDLVRLDVALGETFAQAAHALMKKCGLSRADVDLIGSHGQTIWHAPESKKFAGLATQGTLQLADPAVIATRTGVAVISNFRTRDMAVGGQGAPLVAFADEVLFGGEGEPIAVLNIGGIANITVLAEDGEAMMAFDTGPGNMLIDRAMQQLFDQPYDKGGERAAAGQVDSAWLEEILAHPYFKQAPPKTTGRELFGHAFADELLAEGQRRQRSPEEIIATITAVTALSVARAYDEFVSRQVTVKKLVLGGGGAENHTLRAMLVKYWPHAVKLKQHEDYGVSTKFKEALLFALLAYTTHFGIPNNVPRCTGASQRVCLGEITRA